VIPRSDIRPVVEDPLPSCVVPPEDEIPEESWGGFRDTWYLGRVSPEEAADIISYERRALPLLDRASADQQEFELFAYALDWGESDGLSPALLESFKAAGLEDLMQDPDDFSLLGGLEVGVAGLVYALSAVGCITAASCRWHGVNSWSDCPTVAFAASSSTVEILVDLIRAAGCGLVGARNLLWVEAVSVTDLSALAESIIENGPEVSRVKRLP
jgi:hypothetical protein